MNNRPSMIAVFVHVGQTPNICGGKSPIYADGTFRFVPIYVSPSRPEADPTYSDMGLADFVPSEIRNLPAFRSPEFDTNTYSHLARVGEGHIYERLKEEKGFLMFFTTLHYWDKESPKYEWISPAKGLYIIGYFRVEGIYKDEDLSSDASLQARFRNNGQFGRPNTGKKYLWISGLRGGRARLCKAVPLTEATDPSKWNEFARRNLVTTGGKSLNNYLKAKYNWTLVCPQSNLSSLFEWINEYEGKIRRVQERTVKFSQ